MSDVFTTEKRSHVMSRIRGHGNRDTELALAKLFRLHGITGWRRRQKHFGKPDFTFPHERIIVFVDGCFWHACPRHSNIPSNNREFWLKKLTGNQTRDKLVTKTLRKAGWRVIRIWEHDLTENPLKHIRKIRKSLTDVSMRKTGSAD
jgi:DNA mismatch endonuclease, patch repair protein